MNFIKLSKIIINTSSISTITIHNNLYYINLVPSTKETIALIHEKQIYNNTVIVSKLKDSTDYNIITKWINLIKNIN